MQKLTLEIENGINKVVTIERHLSDNYCADDETNSDYIELTIQRNVKNVDVSRIDIAASCDIVELFELKRTMREWSITLSISSPVFLKVWYIYKIYKLKGWKVWETIL